MDINIEIVRMQLLFDGGDATDTKGQEKFTLEVGFRTTKAGSLNLGIGKFNALMAITSMPKEVADILAELALAGFKLPPGNTWVVSADIALELAFSGVMTFEILASNVDSKPIKGQTPRACVDGCRTQTGGCWHLDRVRKPDGDLAQKFTINIITIPTADGLPLIAEVMCGTVTAKGRDSLPFLAKIVQKQLGPAIKTAVTTSTVIKDEIENNSAVSDMMEEIWTEIKSVWTSICNPKKPLL